MIVLRSIVVEDLEMLREHRNRPDTRVFLGDSSKVSHEQQLEWFERCVQNASPGTEYQIARSSSLGIDVGLVRVIGNCVGADVFATYRGRGLGHAVFAAACSIPPVGSDLWLQVFLENVAAMKIYGRAGFEIDENAPVELRYRYRPNAGMLGATQPGLLHYVKMIRRAS